MIKKQLEGLQNPKVGPEPSLFATPLMVFGLFCKKVLILNEINDFEGKSTVLVDCAIILNARISSRKQLHRGKMNIVVLKQKGHVFLTQVHPFD